MTKQIHFEENKVEKIRNLCKLYTQCKELYTPMLESYDKGDMELPDLLVQFAMIEMNRYTKWFTFWQTKDVTNK